MRVRDRVKELVRVPAGSLRPNPKNWRRHPKSQANALRGLLSELAIAAWEAERNPGLGSYFGYGVLESASWGVF